MNLRACFLRRLKKNGKRPSSFIHLKQKTARPLGGRFRGNELWGIPIVSDLPCFADFISFEEEGFCLKQDVNMNLEDAISEALPKILVLNESLTCKLGLSAWERSKEYEIEKVAQDYLDDFNSLLQK